VPDSKAVYYESRFDWEAASRAELGKKDEKSEKYNPRLRSFFADDDLVKTIRGNYQKIMENVEKSMGRKPYHYPQVIKTIVKCLYDSGYVVLFY